MTSSTNNLGLTERQAIFCSIGFYITTALVMVNVNKWALNTISVPWLLLWSQLLIAAVLHQLSATLGMLRMPKLRFDVVKSLMPMVAINVLGLSVNMFCLFYVDTSFYQIARGLVLPFTVAFTFLFLRQRSSMFVLASCTIVFVGFMTGVTVDINVSKLGVLFGIGSSITTALHAIVIKKSLEYVNGSSIDLVYYNNILSLVIMAPIVLLSGEVSFMSKMLQEGGEQRAFNHLLVGIAVTGVFGFLVNVAGFLQISHTSPTTHMVSGAVRGVLQTLLGYFAFHELITGGRLAGIVMILGGSTIYTFARVKEMQAAEAAFAIIPMTQQDVRIEENMDAIVVEDESSEQAVDEKQTAHTAEK
ncbi:hypothetical protein BG006_006010 [Podila minutissima]|uniref:Sugar phosphate transporter domain-containing protein n=1 Tax=Podila minutissima TaxID=64525 RepID=A0A9P5SJB8_9FUNG|nr:hypothetical protein BG006_006010 [Podila minutissima]